MKIAKNIAKVLGVLLLISIIALVAYTWPLAYELLNNPFNDRSFDRAAWLSAVRGKDEMHYPRGPMADDLQSKYLHKGMTKAAVRKLLGSPDNSQYDDEHHVDYYFLGHWGFLSIDGDYLIVHYDSSDKIRSTEIYCH